MLIEREYLKQLLNETQGSFSTETTGYYLYDLPLKEPEYAEKSKKIYGKIVSMSPEKYIRLCAKAFSVNVEELIEQRNDSSLKEIIKNLKSGSTYNMLVLCYAEKEQDFEQEGLHRAIAAKELGISSVPVLVAYKGEAPKENLELVLGKVSL